MILTKEVAERLEQEIEMLRDFYQHWEKFHLVCGQPVKREAKEIASQRFMDCVYAIREFYRPRKLIQ